MILSTKQSFIALIAAVGIVVLVLSLTYKSKGYTKKPDPTCPGRNAQFNINNVCYDFDGGVAIQPNLLTADKLWICNGNKCTCLHGDTCLGTSTPGAVNRTSVTFHKYSGKNCTGSKVTTQYNADGPLPGSAYDTAVDYVIPGTDDLYGYGICAATCINGVIFERDIVRDDNKEVDTSLCRGLTDPDLIFPGNFTQDIDAANIHDFSDFAILPGCVHDYWEVSCGPPKSKTGTIALSATAAGIVLIIVFYLLYIN
jgi:hypothetical protein